MSKRELKRQNLLWSKSELQQQYGVMSSSKLQQSSVLVKFDLRIQNAVMSTSLKRMSFLLIVKCILLSSCVAKLNTDISSYSCYSKCKCYNGLLINMLCNSEYIDMVPDYIKSEHVEVLDLSSSSIFTLKNNSFNSYDSLKFLYMQHTKLREIEIGAFAGLENVLEIDLSFNNLITFHNEIVLPLSKLSTFSIRGNDLIIMNTNQPILISPSIKFLDISYCSINTLSEESFSKLPSLVEVRIDSNKLKNIDMNWFIYLSNVRNIDIQSNPFLCSCKLTNSSSMLTVQHRDNRENGSEELLIEILHSSVIVFVRRSIYCQAGSDGIKRWAKYEKSESCNVVKTELHKRLYTTKPTMRVTPTTQISHKQITETISRENIESKVKKYSVTKETVVHENSVVSDEQISSKMVVMTPMLTTILMVASLVSLLLCFVVIMKIKRCLSKHNEHIYEAIQTEQARKLIL